MLSLHKANNYIQTTRKQTTQTCTPLWIHEHGRQSPRAAMCSTAIGCRATRRREPAAAAGSWLAHPQLHAMPCRAALHLAMRRHASRVAIPCCSSSPRETMQCHRSTAIRCRPKRQTAILCCSPSHHLRHHLHLHRLSHRLHHLHHLRHPIRGRESRRVARSADISCQSGGDTRTS